MQMRRIIGFGETVLDIIFKEDRPVDAVPGGSTFNSLISLGRTLPRAFPGSEVVMVTRVGDDHIGDITVSFMERNGLNPEATGRMKGVQSTVSTAFLDSNNDATYEFFKDKSLPPYPAGAAEGIHIQKDDIVLFGSFFAIDPDVRDFTRALLLRAREAGAILYYDINFRRNHAARIPELMDNIVENISLSDYVRGSSEDFTFLLGTDDGQKIYDGFIAPRCPNFILTRSCDPVEVYRPGGRETFPVERIKTVSTIGAGDNFNAGFIYGLVRDGILKGQAPQDWGALVGTATKFSSAVCRSIYNYVDEDFLLY